MDEKSDNWKGRFHSQMSLSILGDSRYGSSFIGEARTLLFTVKNAMKIQGLEQHHDRRLYPDGTIITVDSVFGMDRVTIDTTRSSVEGVTAAQFCTVEFKDVVTAAPPMLYTGKIVEGQQEGVDYIKSYFKFDVSQCSKCEDLPVMSLSFSYVVPPSYPYYDDDPADHCTISVDRGCFGEVVEYGVDEDGNYVLWKVFTESGSKNRSGQGYLLATLDIKDKDTQAVVCTTSTVIFVDCCSKTPVNQPDIYWDLWQWVECASGIVYVGGAGYCAVPDEISISKLLWYAVPIEALFYAFPEVGGCPPYTWSTNWGTIYTTDDIGIVGHWRPEGEMPQDCTWDMMIMVTDRCGGQDYFRVPSACEGSLHDVEIGYTSLIMPCDGYQTLSASGGVPPYHWTLSGDGELTVSHDTLTASYHSPETNEGCHHNGTVTLGDCCGDSASITIAVNCYTADAVAFELHYTETGWDGDCLGSWECYCTCQLWDFVDQYHCNNTLHLVHAYNGGCVLKQECNDADCAHVPWPRPTGVCHNGDWKPAMWRVCGSTCCEDCFLIMPGFYDRRTPAMIAAGCCPINPGTGLPF